MDSWTHGLMDSWTHGLMDSWTHGLMDNFGKPGNGETGKIKEYTPAHTCAALSHYRKIEGTAYSRPKQLAGKTHRPIDLWTYGPMDRWTDGPMDLWTYGLMDNFGKPGNGETVHHFHFHAHKALCAYMISARPTVWRRLIAVG